MDFSRIFKMIDDMVETLKAEQASDDKHRDGCITDLRQNEVLSQLFACGNGFCNYGKFRKRKHFSCIHQVDSKEAENAHKHLEALLESTNAASAALKDDLAAAGTAIDVNFINTLVSKTLFLPRIQVCTTKTKTF